MKTFNKTLAIGAAFTAAVILAPAAFAQGRHGPPPPPRPSNGIQLAADIVNLVRAVIEPRPAPVIGVQLRLLLRRIRPVLRRLVLLFRRLDLGRDRSASPGSAEMGAPAASTQQPSASASYGRRPSGTPRPRSGAGDASSGTPPRTGPHGCGPSGKERRHDPGRAESARHSAQRTLNRLRETAPVAFPAG